MVVKQEGTSDYYPLTARHRKSMAKLRQQTQTVIGRQRTTAANSGITTPNTRGWKMIHGDFTFQFRLTGEVGSQQRFVSIDLFKRSVRLVCRHRRGSQAKLGYDTEDLLPLSCLAPIVDGEPATLRPGMAATQALTNHRRDVQLQRLAGISPLHVERQWSRHRACIWKKRRRTTTPVLFVMTETQP